MNEGITVSPELNDVFLKVIEKYFQNRAFAYISNRINSYSVNPVIYLETAKMKNLVGFAVVSKDPKQKMQTKVEKTFFGKEFRQLNTIEEALQWKEETMRKGID